MANSEGLTEVSEAVGAAWKVYELGWVHDYSSSQRFSEFGSDIRSLAQNLTNVVRIVENARLHYQQHAVRSPNFRGFSLQKGWNFSTLYEIVGRIRTTLNECEQLLIQNRGVYLNQNSIYNNEWTLVIQPKVEDLQKRVQAHNSKISILLKPLEIKLLMGIRHEFGAQNTQHNFGLALPALPIQGLLVLDIERAVEEYERPQPISLIIPVEIDSRLHKAVEQSRPELQLPGGLGLQPGIEIFINYFELSTKSFTAGNFLSERTPSPKQYINLLNCLIILRHLRESDELKFADQDSLWPIYIAELADLLRTECERFAASSPQRLIAPDVASLNSELAQGDHGKWKGEEISNLMSPHFNTYMEEVFKVALPSPQESLERELAISRLDSTKLRLVESVASKAAPTNRLGEIKLDIDLRTIQLTPIYATPSSRPKPLEILLHTGTSQLNPSFVEPKHVLRLQHLLTGYKVYNRYDQAMVKVSFFIAGQTMPLEEHGRIQLWMPQPYNPANKISSVSPSPGPPSGGSPSEQSPPPVAPRNRTGSIRKWIPGLRRSSGAAANSPSRSNDRSSSISGSSNHSSSPQESPKASTSRPNFPPITEVARNGHIGFTAPQYGPFELAGDDASVSSARVATSGLCPVSPNMMSAPHANSYPAFGTHNPPAQDMSNTRSRYYASPRSPTSTDQPISNAYSNTVPNSLSHGLQMPTITSSHGPSQLSPNVAPPPNSGNHVYYSSIDPSPEGFLATPSHRQPYTPDIGYNPVLSSRSSRVTPSVMSSMSTRSRSSLAPTVSTIKTSNKSSVTSGSGGIARLHHKPQKPLLVIFLKSRDSSAKLAIVAIQIDTHTSVKRERCECYTSHSACRISCIERDKGGSLLAQRWDANSGLTSWNLARLGESQRKEGENVWSNLRRVSIKFEKMEDRYRFAGSPCSCNVKTTHELSRCNLASHNGLFGIVKQIGEQMLRNYHSERDHAATRTMILGPLPEGEL